MSQSAINSRSHFITVILPWIVCILGALFYCYEFFLRVAPSVMVPQMMSAYNIDAKSLGLISAAYYYIYTPMQFPVGILMDRYGPRRLLTITIFLCALGSLAIAFSTSVFVAVLARFLMGFGSAFAFVGVLKLAVHWLPPNRIALVSGITTALGMFGGIIADDALSTVVDSVGWRMSWTYAAVMGFALCIVVWLVVRDNPPRKQTKIIKRETRTWKQAWFYLTRIFRNPQICLVGFVGTFLFMPITVFGALWGVSFISVVHHVSAVKAGFEVSMIFWGFAVGGPIMGWFSDYIRQRKIILLVGSIVGAILFSLLIFIPSISLFATYFLLFFIGFFCSAQVLIFPLATENAPRKASGSAVATANFLVTLGAVVFQPVAGWILSLDKHVKIVNHVRVYDYYDFRNALLVLPVALCLSVFCILFINETYCQPQIKDEMQGAWQHKKK